MVVQMKVVCPVSRDSSDFMGFKLVFVFGANPYFENETLEKCYEVGVQGGRFLYKFH